MKNLTNKEKKFIFKVISVALAGLTFPKITFLSLAILIWFWADKTYKK